MNREEALKEFVGYQTYDIQPSVEATKMAIEALKLIPDNATNGQMMEQTFPGMEIKYIGFSAVVITTDDSGMEQEFSREWWDAPYNRKEN